MVTVNQFHIQVVETMNWLKCKIRKIVLSMTATLEAAFDFELYMKRKLDLIELQTTLRKHIVSHVIDLCVYYLLTF